MASPSKSGIVCRVVVPLNFDRKIPRAELRSGIRGVNWRMSASWIANLVIRAANMVRDHCGSMNFRLMMYVAFSTLSFTFLGIGSDR